MDIYQDPSGKWHWRCECGSVQPCPGETVAQMWADAHKRLGHAKKKTD